MDSGSPPRAEIPMAWTYRCHSPEVYSLTALVKHVVTARFEIKRALALQANGSGRRIPSIVLSSDSLVFLSTAEVPVVSSDSWMLGALLVEFFLL